MQQPRWMWKGMLVTVAIVLLGACTAPQGTETAGTTETTAEKTAQEPALYPEIEPFETGFLQVSELHEIYYELSGNKDGEPVMALHGGPGVGSYPLLRQYFDPQRYLIVLHDQRGAGRSKPAVELRENTTADLVGDIERLRTHLGLDKVVIFGGSWGSTLALAYAETYPENVRAMVLRGVFTATKDEIWFHYFGTRRFFPDTYDQIAAMLPDPQRGPDPQYLNELIKDGTPEESSQALDAINLYETKMGALQMPDEVIAHLFEQYPVEFRLPMSIIDLHYVTNAYFLEEGQLLRDAGKIGDIPVTIVNGRYDMLCPPQAAYKVHQLLPGSKLILVDNAGHTEREPGISAALVEAMDSLARE